MSMNLGIIRCPFCYLRGEKKQLCEVMEGGLIKIMRHREYDNTDATYIKGDNLSILCGKCGNEVYFQETKKVNIPITYDALEMMGTILLT